jgi:hypothetical protein
LIEPIIAQPPHPYFQSKVESWPRISCGPVTSQFIAFFLDHGGRSFLGERAGEQLLEPFDLGLGFGQVFFQALAFLAGIHHASQGQEDFHTADHQRNMPLWLGRDTFHYFQFGRLQPCQRSNAGSLLAQHRGGSRRDQDGRDAPSGLDILL